MGKAFEVCAWAGLGKDTTLILGRNVARFFFYLKAKCWEEAIGSKSRKSQAEEESGFRNAKERQNRGRP